jgi:hypothetical protein
MFGNFPINKSKVVHPMQSLPIFPDRSIDYGKNIVSISSSDYDVKRLSDLAVTITNPELKQDIQKLVAKYSNPIPIINFNHKQIFDLNDLSIHKF